jgi:capsular polysaccharide biosynthesis protein
VSTDPQRDRSPDLEAEQEVDFGRYWRLIAVRWWLPVGLLAAGLVIGYLVSLGTNSTSYKATAQVYLGQPLAPGASTQVTSAPTSLGLVSDLATSEEVVRRVAAKVGLKANRLRDHITTKPILGITAGRVGTPAPLLSITVEGGAPRKIAAAANELATVVVDRVSGYADVKIQALRDQFAFDERELKDVAARIAQQSQQQQALLEQAGLSASERLIASVNFNNVLIFLDQRRASLERDRLDVRQQLSLATDVERGRIVSPAVATKTAGPNSRTGAAIGGLIGLIVGIFAALFWDPVAVRVRARNGT